MLSSVDIILCLVLSLGGESFWWLLSSFSDGYFSLNDRLFDLNRVECLDGELGDEGSSSVTLLNL
jgi:hypothetical protein